MATFGDRSNLRQTASAPDDSEPSSAIREGLTILLVDARPWTREALARALETTGRDVRVLRFSEPADLMQARSGSGAVILLNVTGLGLADRRVSAAAAVARSCLPGLPIVAVSDRLDADDMLGAIERGLSGCIPISLELRQAADALRFVAAGGTFVPAEQLLASLHRAAKRESPAEDPPHEPSVVEATTAALVNERVNVDQLLHALTPRERAVLERMHQGKSNKLIARDLDLREATVKVHVLHIMRKFGVVNRTQAALIADQLVDKETGTLPRPRPEHSTRESAGEVE